MTDQYAVIGNPIAHSKSPLIHARFAEQTGQRMEYGRLLGAARDFAGDVRRFIAAGGRGLNVTVPFKEEAWALASTRSARAEIAGAVNTLVLRDDQTLLGDNTDGAGLVRDLGDNLGFAWSGKRVLLIGAGGAARGVLLPLLDAGARELIIANRTASKALDLAAISEGRAKGCGLENLSGERFDLLVNATSSGLDGAVPALPPGCLAAGAWTYDMLYADVATPFQRWSREQGAAKAVDGLGMLVEQAAESFLLWRGVRPLTGPVIEALRQGNV